MILAQYAYFELQIVHIKGLSATESGTPLITEGNPFRPFLWLDAECVGKEQHLLFNSEYPMFEYGVAKVVEKELFIDHFKTWDHALV